MVMVRPVRSSAATVYCSPTSVVDPAVPSAVAPFTVLEMASMSFAIDGGAPKHAITPEVGMKTAMSP